MMTNPWQQYHPAAALDFDLTMSITARFAHPALDRIDADGVYWRVVRAGAGLALMRVARDLRAEIVAVVGSVGAAEAESAFATLRHVLAIADDPTPFYDYAQSQAGLWQVVAGLRGARFLRTASVYEALMCLIIEQHISWVSAQRSQQALLAWADQKIVHNGRTHYAFPTPAQLAHATADDLKPLKLTTRRSAALITISAQVACGALDVEALTYDGLLRVSGVGPWTAANVVARAHGDYAHIPSGDVALQAAANLYFNGARGKLTPQATHALFARFGQYGGLAAHYTMLRWVLDNYPKQV